MNHKAYQSEDYGRETPKAIGINRKEQLISKEYSEGFKQNVTFEEASWFICSLNDYLELEQSFRWIPWTVCALKRKYS